MLLSTLQRLLLCQQLFFSRRAPFTFQDIEELAKAGMMNREETERKSKGFIGDVAAIFEALSGGAHIVKREDGTL